MAWSDTLLDASFRSVAFDCLRTQDSAQRDVAVHEYPYLDGADTEDLGRKARRISITAVFWGADYESRLQTFLKACDEAGPAELVHPVFGSFPRAQLLDYQVAHDADAPDYCTVELSFLEAAPGNPFFVQQLPAQAASVVSQLAETARFGGIESFAKQLDLVKGLKGNLSRLNALRDVLTSTLGVLRGQLKGFVGTTLDLIDFPRAFTGDVMGILSGMVDLRSFDPATLASDWKSLVGQFDNVVQLPAKVAGGAAVADGATSGSGTTIADVKPIPAMPEDVTRITAVLQLGVAAALADAAGEILAAEALEPTLSPREIEQVANDVREAIQVAIDGHRDMLPVDEARPITEPLKDTAHSIHVAAVAVIDAKPPLVTRTVDSAGNLHLVAFRWYGDYSRAAELVRLNPQLRNPNFLIAGDVLNAYSR
ncbi:DNA circularization protein [Cupriavidus sp. BIC8F]|uniref:DNA circularization protein n=1 Tax=Cupriavidus sp. BIC8F TaxID=3079014 RepID=UPI00291628CC|nr:DNA circularization N-terminal domain-containing protein [Cupriavidus sp. BIC8F]